MNAARECAECAAQNKVGVPAVVSVISHQSSVNQFRAPNRPTDLLMTDSLITFFAPLSTPANNSPEAALFLTFFTMRSCEKEAEMFSATFPQNSLAATRCGASLADAPHVMVGLPDEEPRGKPPFLGEFVSFLPKRPEFSTVLTCAYGCGRNQL
jgi:hypothetical protein